jgi:hypothetical protein
MYRLSHGTYTSSIELVSGFLLEPGVGTNKMSGIVSGFSIVDSAQQTRSA